MHHAARACDDDHDKIERKLLRVKNTVDLHERRSSGEMQIDRWSARCIAGTNPGLDRTVAGMRVNGVPVQEKAS
jgi:hypothetical protein